MDFEAADFMVVAAAGKRIIASKLARTLHVAPHGAPPLASHAAQMIPPSPIPGPTGVQARLTKLCHHLSAPAIVGDLQRLRKADVSPDTRSGVTSAFHHSTVVQA
jgi:hypothetical protein